MISKKRRRFGDRRDGRRPGKLDSVRAPDRRDSETRFSETLDLRRRGRGRTRRTRETPKSDAMFISGPLRRFEGRRAAPAAELLRHRPSPGLGVNAGRTGDARIPGGFCGARAVRPLRELIGQPEGLGDTAGGEG